MGIMRSEAEIKAMLDRVDAQLERSGDDGDTEGLEAIRDAFVYMLFDYIEDDRITQYFFNHD
jgi:hypothetical protein